ncbi:putative glucosyl-3-phosphoglycerate synthase [uncultured Collinsella sp.]|nr:putative glucosyl-3-phosphoglycerate synthase [uncultured Collinsella sp.]
MSKSLCVRRGGSAAVLLCSAVCASGLLLDLSGASSTYSEITHLFGEVHGASYIVAELLCSLPARDGALAVLGLTAALFALFRRAGRGASPAGESASALNRGASEPEGTGVLVRSASTAEDGMPRFARGASAADAGEFAKPRSGGGASAWVVAVLFAAAMLFGRSFDETGSAAYVVGGITPAIRSCWYFIGWLLPARALVELAFEGLDRLRAHGTCPSGDRARSVSPSCGRLRRAAHLVLGAFDRHPFAAPALVLALCWLPVLIGYAPALFMWDTNTQVLQWFGLPNHISSSVDLLDSSVLLTQHHPPLHTALVGLCVQAGISLAGSENLGIFIYAVLQWTADILAISWAFRIAQIVGAPRAPRFVALGFIALVPAYSNYSVLVTKDVLFASALLLFAIELVYLVFCAVSSDGRIAFSRRHTVLLVAGALGTALLRSGMVVAVAGGALAATLLLWRMQRRLAREGLRPVSARSLLRVPLIALALVIAVNLLLARVVYPALAITPSSKREALSIPMQQVARFMRDRPDAVQPEDLRAIDRVLDAPSLARLYDPSKSDPVKATYKEQASPDDLSAFWQTWARLFARDPGCFISATAANYYGYFYPAHAMSWSYTSYFSSLVMANTETNLIYSDIASYFSFHQLDHPLVRALDGLCSGYRLLFQRLPFLTLTMQAALYDWALVLLTAYAVRRRRSHAAVFLVPAWVVLLIALVGPCNATTYFRYAYPVALLVPFLALVIMAPDPRDRARRASTFVLISTTGGSSMDSPSNTAACAAAAADASAGTVDAATLEAAETAPAAKGHVAVLIPCYNEELTVGEVIDDFRQVLPGASIYVYDNNSSDRTAQVAREHGAQVRFEPRQGKGVTVRQMFRDIEADCYLLVDGDSTYPADAAPSLIDPILAGEADMTVGDRLSNGSYAQENQRPFHDFGNNLVRWLIRLMYGYAFHDVMTGYRAFSRVFVRSMPVVSRGFQLECEISIHAVDKGWRIKEVPIDYRDRPAGSVSKLSTVSDGVRVLMAIGSLFKDYLPFKFFSLVAAVFVALGLAAGIPVVAEFAQTGYVSKVPSAILAVGLVFCGALAFSTGCILDTVAKATRKRWELDVYRAEDEMRRRQR